jgi:hypothetical protein
MMELRNGNGISLESAVFTVSPKHGCDRQVLSLIADCAVRSAVPTVVIGAAGQEAAVISALGKSVTNEAMDESGFIPREKMDVAMSGLQKLYDAPILFIQNAQ